MIRNTNEYTRPLFHDFLNSLLHIKPVRTAGSVIPPRSHATNCAIGIMRKAGKKIIACAGAGLRNTPIRSATKLTAAIVFLLMY
jgi:hypothetical protein